MLPMAPIIINAPNYRFLFCKMFAFVMSRQQYEDRMKCIHVVEDNQISINRETRNYNKLRKIRWLFYKTKD